MRSEAMPAVFDGVRPIAERVHADRVDFGSIFDLDAELFDPMGTNATAGLFGEAESINRDVDGVLYKTPPFI